MSSDKEITNLISSNGALNTFTSDANLLSLKLLKEVFSDDNDSKQVFKQVAKNEAVFLKAAAEALQKNGRLRIKFGGMNLQNIQALANKMRDRMLQKEMEASIDKYVEKASDSLGVNLEELRKADAIEFDPRQPSSSDPPVG